MPSIGDGVGIRFVEAMSGRVRGDTSRTDDDTGQFIYELDILIPSLNRFVDAAQHECVIEGGTITWVPFLPKTQVNPGHMAMFRAEDSSRKRKFFDFNFTFPSGLGYDIEAEGHKILHDDEHGFDAASDLSTVYLTLSAQGNAVAKGVVSVHITEFVRQLDSLHVTGAVDEAEEAAAKEIFFSFMNAEVREIYPGIPLILRQKGRLTLEERRTIELCARVILPDPLPAEGPQIGEVVDALERFMKTTSADEIDDFRQWFQAFGLIVPILDDDLRGLRRFVRDQLKAKTQTPIRDVLSFVHSLVALPYYSHVKTDRVVGYARPVHVARTGRTLPVQDEPPNREFDVVIAGSGPAGSLLAERLSAAGRSVLLLEAGLYVPEKDITTDELDSIARLYKSSGLQRANQPRSIFDDPGPAFFVLQGGCVGGGGVVNNAVCFQLPAARLQQWRDEGFPIDADQLGESYLRVARELPIVPVSDATDKLNPAWKVLKGAFGEPKTPALDELPRSGFYECLVNLEKRVDGDPGSGCIGTGLCNVGCGSERKRNAYQVHLPRAVENGCVIVASARAVEVKMSGGLGAAKRVEGLVVRMRDGRNFIVHAREYILSAGPIGSSELLLRSPDVMAHARAHRLPIGRRFSANVGSPLFAFMDSPLSATPAVQIAHYVVPENPLDGYIVETWYNPPAANALAMPGYLDEHFERMRLYTSTVAAAPLVGTRPRGRISVENGKLWIDLPLSGYEVERIANGLAALAKAFIAGGAQQVIANFQGGRVMKTAGDADKLHSDLMAIRDNRARLHQLQVGTGHPQGGSAMSLDPEIGVLDGAFRVRGVENLRICDGSIFPDSTGVNPQWTIMALADRCAAMMVAE
jgi:choline dehydrogenase-like flavoprotein